MEETNIRKYAQLMQELDLTGLEISEHGKTVRLERASSVVASTPVSVVATNTAVSPSAPSPVTESEDPNLVSVRSPMVGVFYAAPAENQRPFVSVGDQVHKGDVLCIIESMKLMNEITSDFDGIVTEISVGNQQVVDYGHVLFQIRKEKP